ncbi:MAG: Rne/Rng family ribonuclease [Pseudomonadota bacterium]
MSRQMLINAAEREEFRIALVENGNLEEFYVEAAARPQLKGNIYKASVANVEKSLGAAFVNYGGERNGFLQIDEVHPEYYKTYFPGQEDGRHPPINQAISRHQEMLVQVTKESSNRKGVALTTYISLAGRYLVLMPGSDSKGISRKIESEEERARLKEVMGEVEVPDEIGYIVRTAAEGAKKRDVQADLKYLLRLWDSIKKLAMEAPTPSLVYRERDFALRCVRDYFTPDVKEIMVDDKDTYKAVKDFLRIISPRHTGLVKLHKEKQPLFSVELEEQIERIYSERVPLKSGGSMVINITEALTSIDVNSGRSTQERHLEETALRTNLEASAEAARQLRLRDLGGLIVIDFIDMRERKHMQAVEKGFRAAVKGDRARIDMSKLSKFGLMEISRQRLRPAVQFAAYELCPNCQGKGMVKSCEAQAIFILRRLRQEMAKDDVGRVEALLPLNVAGWLLNRKREELVKLETRYGSTIVINGRPDMLPAEAELTFGKREIVEPEVEAPRPL